MHERELERCHDVFQYLCPEYIAGNCGGHVVSETMEVRSTISNLPTWNPAALLRMTGLISKHSFKLTDTPDLTGKVAVVTGGQAGIGKEITAQLLLHGISMVYIIARTESKYNAAKSQWTAEGISVEDLERRTGFVQCDLSDIQDVKRAAEVLKNKLERLDILINNAGIQIICLDDVKAKLMAVCRPTSYARVQTLCPRYRDDICNKSRRAFFTDQLTSTFARGYREQARLI
jgi:hypothetical protein